MVDLEGREQIKKKVLMLFSEPGIMSITSTIVVERFDIAYPTALGILFDLALDGFLLTEKKGMFRLFYLNREKLLPPKRALLLKEAQ